MIIKKVISSKIEETVETKNIHKFFEDDLFVEIVAVSEDTDYIWHLVQQEMGYDYKFSAIGHIDNVLAINNLLIKMINNIIERGYDVYLIDSKEDYVEFIRREW